MAEFRESQASLLRPHQVEDMRDEERRLTEMLQGPPHISGQIQDRPAMARTLRKLKTQLHQQAPRPYTTDEKDAAIKREGELRDQFTNGMPTHQEMRKNPAGATDKNRAWDQRNKQAVLEWKHIRLRLHAGGDIPNTVADARDVANVEMFRPRQASHEVNMANAQIPGQEWYLPTGQIPIRNVMSNEDRVSAGLPQDDSLPPAPAKMPTETID